MTVDLDAAYRAQESRIEHMESRMDRLETSYEHIAGEMEALSKEIEDWRSDLSACSHSKDEKISQVSTEVHSIKLILGKLEEASERQAEAIHSIATSLADIARGLPDWQEVTKVYQSAKGGIWLVRGFTKTVVGIAAALGAWYVITHTTLTVPK